MKAEIQIKKLTSADLHSFQSLVTLFQEVFEMNAPVSPKLADLQKLLEKSEFIVFVALLENKVIGGLTAYELPMYYGKYSEVFIYDIAVKLDYQQKGIGKLLISSLKSYCNQMGIKELFVAANVEDEHALDFYRSTGGKPEQVIHFNYLSAE